VDALVVDDQILQPLLDRGDVSIGQQVQGGGDPIVDRLRQPGADGEGGWHSNSCSRGRVRMD
jgi:hypothetical protein